MSEERRGPAVRIARWSANNPWKAIVGWSVLVMLCVGAGTIVGTNQAGGSDFWVGEAGRAESIATDGDLEQLPTERVLITQRGGGQVGHLAARAADDVAHRLDALPSVDQVQAPRTAQDRTAVLVTFTMAGTAKDATATLPDVDAQVEQVRDGYRDVQLEQTGTVSTSKGNGQQLGSDLLRAELITFPVTLVILLLVFGALLAAAVPLLLAISSVVSALGLYGLASYAFPDAGGAVANIVLLMGMAVGVDYSLFYLKRVREERARASGRIDHRTAVELATETSGHAIVVSGVAVLVSLAGLYLADDVIFSSITTGSIIVVVVAMLSSLTVLPALLAKLGGRVDRRSVRKNGARPESEQPSRVWQGLLRPATRHPAVTLAVATGAMLVLALPTLDIKLRVEGNDTFPKTIPAIATYDRMIHSFPAEGIAHFVAVKADAGQADTVRRALISLDQRAKADPLFADTAEPRLRSSADGRIATLELPVPTGTNAEASIRSLEVLRMTLLPETVGAVPGAQYAVSGQVARSMDYVKHQGERTPLIVGFVLLATFVMMSIAFRSVAIGLVGVALNVLSAAAAFGALVAVFQGTWAQGLLGLTSGGFVSSRIPLILFVILFGLSMDYQVFVVSRIREGVLAGLPTRQAVAEGITRSAGVVTSAAVVMVSVFISFMFVSLLELKQIGFGLAVAVILDAVLIRVLVLPSLLMLLGHHSWWPCRMPIPSASGAVARQSEHTLR
ncbi:MMPL family transporter [Pseudonocardia alni]|uniref:MMPL family transporter n=1 Tax=Pseudonocardia alni TaxID=33907 RepID=UPI00280BACE9|nr:MMPL family transporter [Pseudonocardia alni]